jgi:hypothetical protein
MASSDPPGAAETWEETSQNQVEIDQQCTLVSFEFSLHAIRQPDVAKLLVEHELRVRSELALLVTEALEQVERLPTLPVHKMAAMIIAVTEGNDIQTLTDEAAGQTPPPNLGSRAVTALLWHFSVPSESVTAPEGGRSR